MNQERLQVFWDDYKRLQQLSTQANFQDACSRESSVIIYKWLFDRHPLLLELCGELNINILFPGETDQHKEYRSKIRVFRPNFYQKGQIGGDTPFGVQWVPLDDFKQEAMFIVGEHDVTLESFVKFVRHKLGGAHLDLENRTNWQRGLKAFSEVVELKGTKAINYQMSEIVKSILQAIEHYRLVEHLV